MFAAAAAAAVIVMGLGLTARRSDHRLDGGEFPNAASAGACADLRSATDDLRLLDHTEAALLTGDQIRGVRVSIIAVIQQLESLDAIEVSGEWNAVTTGLWQADIEARADNLAAANTRFQSATRSLLDIVVHNDDPLVAACFDGLPNS